MIVGLIRPDEGQVLLGTQDLAALPMHQRARMGLGYLPQEASVFRGLKVRENLELVLEGRKDLSKSARRARAEALMAEFGIAHLQEAPSTTLSGGERRRLEIARSLALSPSLILLDEPFAGIDPMAVAELQTLIGGLKQKGYGVLITDHNWRETLQICDRGYIMSQGRIVAEGAPDSIRANPVVREVYLGAAV
jgi:lipopolysaccharide export system ATP-binding protein